MNTVTSGSHTTEPAPQPNWDMTPYFSQLGGADYQTFRETLSSDIRALQQETVALGDLTANTVQAWVALLQRLEETNARSNHLGSYLGCSGAADSRNEFIQSENAALSTDRAEFAKVFVTVRAAFRQADKDVFTQLVNAPELQAIGYFLERLRTSASWSMTPELEALAADLDVTGLSAWGRLYDQVSGTLEFDLQVPGQETQRLPVSVTRSLLEDPNPTVRKAALVGSNVAWEQTGHVTAACLNAISGTRLSLYKRRGIQHFLEPALFDAGISQATLDAMLGVVTKRGDVAHRYLRRKAQILGRSKLGFQDLMAPLPFEEQATIPWDAACERVHSAFGSLYPDLSHFVRMAFDQDWIDYSPRPGKRPGGFCSTSSVIKQSRIFMTYNETLGDLSTLAHELGHAFHGWLMRDMRPWSRRYPMTLAETASTFAEQLIIDAVLTNPHAAPQERTTVLDSRLQDAAVFLLNIPMRFFFEKAVYEERAKGELSVSRFKELMLDAQRQCYGDCLAEDELDPWFWASKLHFYITGISFYNFPYTFGYLFSLGIFALAKQDGADFLPRYEELLRLTGSDTTERVATRCLGVDLGAPDFWNASIDLIEKYLARFETEATALFGAPA
jgi:oligoendopeptidase F